LPDCQSAIDRAKVLPSLSLNQAAFCPSGVVISPSTVAPISPKSTCSNATPLDRRKGDDLIEVLQTESGCRRLVRSGELRLIDEELDSSRFVPEVAEGASRDGLESELFGVPTSSSFDVRCGQHGCIGMFAIIRKTSSVLTLLRISAVFGFMVSTIPIRASPAV
jgi:hypothetical protein